MKTCIDYINNKHTYIFNFDKLIELNNWCAKTYFDGCVQLYNLGRLSVPSEFVKEDFLATLSDDELNLLVNPSTGKLNLNYKLIDALLYLNKFEDKDTFEYLAQILYAMEVNSVLCDMNKGGRERSNTGVEKVSINIKENDELRINKGIDYFNYDILNCLEDSDNKRFVGYMDFSDIYLEKIAEYLGIDNDTYMFKYYYPNRSLMFENRTFDDDKYLAMLYLNGELFGDTAIAKKFEDLYLKFYKDLYVDKDKNKPKSFFDKVFKDCFETIDKFINNTRVSLLLQGASVEDRSISVDKWSFWSEKQVNEPYIPKHHLSDDFNIGVYLFDHTANDFIQDVPLRLHGISGEYVLFKDRRKYNIKGYPVKIGETTLYPVYNIIDEVANCIELPKLDVKKPTLQQLGFRETEILGVLLSIDRDIYSVDDLRNKLKHIDFWWKTFDKYDKNTIIKNITDVYAIKSV